MISSFRQKVQANKDWGRPDPAETPGGGSAKARKRRPAAQAPITAHRLFPVFTALWFAALFGLGSLAISPEVLGALVSKIGLSALVPAAAPPLGFTARLLVALLLTVVGGGFGLGLGLRLRGPNAAPARPAGPAPLNAKVAKAAKDQDADLPKVRARDAHPDAPPRRPLVLTEAFAEPVSPFAAPLIDETPVDNVMVQASPLLRGNSGSGQSADPMVQRDSWLPVYEPVSAAFGADALEPLDLDVLDLSETKEAPAVVAFAAPAPVAQPGPPPLLAATPQVPSGVILARPSPEQILAGEPWSPVASTPLADLGLVQLIERLALAIAARKAAREAGPPPPDGTPVEAAVEASSEVAAEAPAESATETSAEEAAGPFAKPANAPPKSTDIPLGSVRDAVMRRLEAAAPPASLPTAMGAGPAPFSRPQRADAVVPLRRDERAQADEAAAAATAAPVGTEEALRSALATLQRIGARG